MELSTYNLETLGSHALGHYKAAEKHKDKSEQQYISAGIYLKEAKQRTLKTRGMTFELFLHNHCQIGRSRAYEIIAIADGRKTVDDERERASSNRQKQKDELNKYRKESVRTDKHPEKPNEINESYNDVIEEAENLGEDETTRLRNIVRSLANKATLAQLKAMERAYNG